MLKFGGGVFTPLRGRVRPHQGYKVSYVLVVVDDVVVDDVVVVDVVVVVCLFVCWLVGSLVRWFVGSLVRWFVGSLHALLHLRCGRICFLVAAFFFGWRNGLKMDFSGNMVRREKVCDRFVTPPRKVVLPWDFLIIIESYYPLSSFAIIFSKIFCSHHFSSFFHHFPWIFSSFVCNATFPQEIRPYGRMMVNNPFARPYFLGKQGRGAIPRPPTAR